MRRALILGSIIALLAGPAMAQGNNAISVYGVVDKLDATTISVKNDDGGAVEAFKLAPTNVLYLQNKPASLHDIKNNDFVATAAVRQADGKLHSTELRIFPDAMRGVGEGQRPMNDARNQTMTNATVTGTAMLGASNSLKVKFPGGESEVIVDPGVPVIAITPADKALVKVGTKVRVQGVRNAEGAMVNRITLQ